MSLSLSNQEVSTTGVLARLRQGRETYLRVCSDDPVVRSRGRTLLWSLLLLSAVNLVVMLMLYILISDLPAFPVVILIQSIVQAVYTLSIMLARRGHVEAGALCSSGLVGVLLLISPVTYGGLPVVYFLSYVPLILAAATLSPRNIVLMGLGHLILGHLVYAYAGSFGSGHPVDLIYMVMWSLVCMIIVMVGALQASVMSRTFCEIDQMHDLKQRLELEKMIAERDRLSALHQITQQESRAKSQFLATMSHELRTPLNAIIGYSELIQEEYEDRELEDPEILGDLGHILSSGHHLLGLIDDVLDLAHVEAGEMQIAHEAFALHELLRECAVTIKPMLHERLRMTLAIREGTPTTWHSDRLKVQQVVLNLLSNAAKFTHAGEITLGARLCESGELEVSVVDTGIGIARAHHEVIFEAFKQVDASTTREYGGTGLGLSLSKRLVEFLGGGLWLESAPGEGSTFAFTLPAG